MEDLQRLSKEELVQKINELTGRVKKLEGIAEEGSNYSEVHSRLYDEFFEFLPVSAFETDARGFLTRVNMKSLSRFGYSPEDVIGKKGIHDVLHMKDKKKMDYEVMLRKSGIRSEGNEYLGVTSEGEFFEVMIFAEGLFEKEKFVGLRGVLIDISEKQALLKEKERLNEQLRHSRRLESLGRLAAGVAHDFNNLLSPIIGYSELLLENTELPKPASNDVSEIYNAAIDAKDIVQQLLTFGQQQLRKEEIINMSTLLQESSELYARVVPEDVSISFNSDKESCHVNGDRTQIKQVLLNLVINAGEALSRGGEINVAVDNRIARKPLGTVLEEIPSGDYCVLSVTDNGHGMEQETIKKIFEPFFTTKEASPESGLGMAIVWGIVKSHDAFIRVESVLEQGTTVEVYFPVVHDEQREERDSAIPNVASPEMVTVLIVENNVQVCNLAKRLLEREGYNVISTYSPRDVENVLKGYRGAVDLLLSDVIMPDENGVELASRLKKAYPGLKVLYMSGYSRSVISERNVSEDTMILSKPFNNSQLQKMINKTLNSGLQ